MNLDNNFYQFFDREFYEHEKIFLKLRYGYNPDVYWEEIDSILANEPMELIYALWSAMDRFEYENDIVDELDPDLNKCRNDLMVQNFAERFGLDTIDLLWMCAGNL